MLFGKVHPVIRKYVGSLYRDAPGTAGPSRHALKSAQDLGQHVQARPGRERTRAWTIVHRAWQLGRNPAPRTAAH